MGGKIFLPIPRDEEISIPETNGILHRKLVFLANSFIFVQALRPQGAHWLSLNGKSVYFIFV